VEILEILYLSTVFPIILVFFEFFEKIMSKIGATGLMPLGKRAAHVLLEGHDMLKSLYFLILLVGEVWVRRRDYVS